jgi:predicted PurR-regulated permease PerM
MSPGWPRLLRYIVLVLLIVAVALFAYYIRELLRPLAAAGFTAYLLMPLANWLAERLRWRRPVAAHFVFFLSFAIVIGLVVSIVPVLFSQVEEIEKVMAEVEQGAQRLLVTGIRLGPFVWHPAFSLPDLSTLLAQVTPPVLQNALEIVETTSRGIASLLLYFVSLYYFLTHWERIRSWLLGLAPPPYDRDVRQLYEQIRAVWVGYLWGQLILMLIVGVAFTIAWLFIGLPGALIMGPLTGLLTLIPDAGPFIATIIAVVVALLEGSLLLPLSNWLFALLVLIVYGILIAIKNVWIRPRVVGRSVEMHQGLVFVAIVGALIYGGILGALVVIPVMASLGVIGRYLRQRILGLEPFPGVESQPTVEEPIPVISPPAEEPRESEKAGP